MVSAHGAAAKPDVNSGTFWYKACTPGASAVSTGVCTAYVQGLTTGMIAQAATDAGPTTFCLPDSVSYSDQLAVFMKFLEQHPEGRHILASALFLTSMNRAYPCPG